MEHPTWLQVFSELLGRYLYWCQALAHDIQLIFDEDVLLCESM